MREEAKSRLKALERTPPWNWPRNAGEVLQRVLRDPASAPSDRLRAAGLGGDLVVMDDQMAELLLSIVQGAGEPEELRARAAISLGPVLEETETDGFDDDFSDPPISEEVFDRIGQTLRDLFMDQGLPKELRRRILEASVRAPQDWHADAIRAAYASGDEEWKLSAVFGMRWVRGFDDQILEALESRNLDILYEAVQAAGNWELRAAWPRVAELISAPGTRKDLRLAGIEAAAGICPPEDWTVLRDLADSADKDIRHAVREATQMMHLLKDRGGEDDDDYEEEDEDQDEDQDIPPRKP